MATDRPMRQAALEFWESNGGCVTGAPGEVLQARHSVALSFNGARCIFRIMNVTSKY
jgi:hypothetical protein